ncbi:MAG: Cna B-type domain-containing protein, partial [Ruminococcus sp.]
SGMQWNIFRAGERISDNKIEFQGDFAEYPVYLPDLTVSSLQNAANSLDNYASVDKIKPLATGVSDAQGKITFTGLEDGIYLVSGKRRTVGTVWYIPTPMFVEIKDGKTVTSYAKFTVRKKPTLDEDMYQIKKQWYNDNIVSGYRPVEVEVEIYRNDEYYKTVVLNKDNGWSYEWTADTSYEWRIKEINIHSDYKVVYDNNETQFLLINYRDVLSNSTTVTTDTTTSTTTGIVTTTQSNTEISTQTTHSTTSTENTSTTSETEITETTPVSTSSSELSSTTDSLTSTASVSKTTTTSTKKQNSGGLPQTGQLWWPVPVCGAAGIILFAAGWRISRKK